MYDTKNKGYLRPEINIWDYQSVDAIMSSLVDAIGNAWSDNPWGNNGGEYNG